MITWKNYEEYIMMHADGELSVDEELALAKFIEEHPELKAELAAYESVRLLPDETMVYEGKESLVKPVAVKRTIVFPNWQRYGIAAGVTLLVFISIFKWETHSNTVVLSTGNVPEANSSVHVIAPVANSNSVTPGSANTLAAIKNQQLSANKNTPGNSIYNNTATAMKHTYKKDSERIDIDDIDKVTKIEIDELPIAAIKKIPVMQQVPEIPSLIEVPEYEISAADQDHKRSFLDKLQLDEANKNQLKTIARIASGAAQGISNAKQELDDKAITINIKNNTLRISL